MIDRKLETIMTRVMPLIYNPGTPDEAMWPGVTQLPDYKNTFPKWPPQDLNSLVPSLESTGKQLLMVSQITLIASHGESHHTNIFL